MVIEPGIETVKNLLRQYRRVPVSISLMADMVTPVQVFACIKSGYKNCFLLESADRGKSFGRYSFIGYAPSLVVSCKEGQVHIREGEGERIISGRNPFEVLKDIAEENQMPILPGMPRFAGGLTGYIGYDAIRYTEPAVSSQPKDDMGLNDIKLMDCSRIVVFDHLLHTMQLITHVTAEGDIEEKYAGAEKTLNEMAEEIKAMSLFIPNKGSDYTIQPDITKTEYMESVKKAKKEIYEGEAFQIVISRRISIINPPDGFQVYRAVRASEPSPYMYYFGFDDCIVVGSSPEKLVSVANGLVTTNPIAGTISRGDSEEEDEALKKQLLNDEKEIAEHTMLVDLSRNDLGRICAFGTVSVDKFMQIEMFSKLMHIVSEVTGTLKEDMGCIDALRYCMPAGTLSGAPKIRAMQIIDETEQYKRGIYGGAIGYIGYNGIMDTCIAIRTAVFKDGRAVIQAGAGIVADSVPEKEYEETKIKTAAMLNAFKKAGELN